MIPELKKILRVVGIAFLILFIIFVANQLAALYQNLSVIHPVLAIVGTTVVGLIVLAACLAPVMLLSKLPAPLPFPDDDESLAQYKRLFKERLATHPVTVEHKLDVHKDEDLEELDKKLKERADKIIFESASAVFISTAISQNGKLDAFTVLLAQIRMIWKVSHVYWQRPSWKNLQQLYVHVAFNAMAASSIEQMDITQQIQPIVNAMVRSSGHHIPVVGNATRIITESIMEGTVNAFLTLRVGVLTKNFCFPEAMTIKEVKSNSFLEASILLKQLVVKSSKRVIEGILKAGKNASVQTIKSSYDAIGKAVNTTKSGIGSIFTKRSKAPTDTSEQ